jgi:hypothetical protein
MYRDLLLERNEIVETLAKYKKDPSKQFSPGEANGIVDGLSVGKAMAKKYR